MSARARGVAALLMALVLVAGCGGDRPAAAGIAPRAYHPERFPDIPLAPGYMLAPGHDQLAVAMAGGVVRRFDVWMVAKPGQADLMRPAELLAWYDERLPALGWSAVGGGSGERRFRRAWPEGSGEELTIVASGSMSGPTVEYHLAPTRETPAKP